MPLTLSVHGGGCCGMKTIHTFAYVPSCIEPALEAIPNMCIDQIGRFDQTGRKRFFWEAAPEETTEQRFHRYLAFLDKERPYGICEVTFNEEQIDIWRPIVEKEGFKEVSNCYNSNSKKRIYIFHRVKDKEEQKDAEAE